MASISTIMLATSPFTSRKSSYKLPPTTITDKLVSQEARRNKALEEQKRRRAQKFDSARHLDQFADLNLGLSDNELPEDDGEDVAVNAQVAPGSVARYAVMLTQDVGDLASPDQRESCGILTLEAEPIVLSTTKKNKKKRKSKNKQNKWADRCMYAELLEMVAPTTDEPWDGADGLPEDLESGWVAVGPVPQGKRCLAVTQAAVGVPGSVPNTVVRSRLLGKVLIHRFPSVLPPLTVLDCILDARWHENGILHVLDVVKWKGQDISDCESAFRFWWRDTRLAELAQSAPPPSHSHTSLEQSSYTFPYPTTFIPVPYNADTTLPTLLTQVIPAAKTPRLISVMLPISTSNAGGEGMEVDTGNNLFEFGRTLAHMDVQVEPDGLLLYVKEASYEAGTSPLSSWIPIAGCEAQDDTRTEGQVQPQERAQSPLEVFYRLVHKRSMHTQKVGEYSVLQEVDMEA